MLHLVVNSHNPEYCAFRGEEERRALTGGFDRLGDLAAERGVEIQGPWFSRVSHEVFVVVDAPDAHAVEDLVAASGLVSRTTTRILPLVTQAQLREALGTDG
ncbi:MAG: DUF3303 family protein [Nitriliruptorales bacterium]